MQTVPISRPANQPLQPTAYPRVVGNDGQAFLARVGGG